MADGLIRRLLILLILLIIILIVLLLVINNLDSVTDQELSITLLHVTFQAPKAVEW